MIEDIHDAILDLTDRWHDGEGRGMPLCKWLGLTDDEYAAFVERSALPDSYEVPERPPEEGKP